MRDSLSYTQQLGRNILRVYLGVSLLMLLLISIGLRHAWIDHVAIANRLLIRNASAVSTTVQSTVIDASKVLNIARVKLEEQLHNGSVSPRIASKILSEISQDLMYYRTADPFGLLFSTDSEGNLYGKSGPSIRDGVNLSDRYYFQDLKTHPYKQFSIGNQVKTRTTDKNAFHVAMSLQDKDGNFAGIIAQQILEEDLSAALEGVMTNGDERTYTYAPNHLFAFAYPSSELDEPNRRANSEVLLKIIDKELKTRGSLKISGDEIGLNENVYVGYAWSPQLQIYTVSSLPENSLIYAFLGNNISTALLGLLSFISATVLFIVLYNQSKQIEASYLAATHDALTGLSNRRAIDEEFERLSRESMRSQQPISVLFMDIDHFKVVNDTYGHEMGDRVLRAVAMSIKATLKRPLDICCRWGGEEFVAILPRTDEQGALKIANDIMAAMRRLRVTEGETTLEPITISIGIKTATINAENVHDDLIDMADKAMFKAKQDGRDRVVVYQPSLKS